MMTATDRPLRVVHVINSLAYGGAETRVISLVNSLNRRLFLPTVVTLQNIVPLARRVRTDVPVLSLGVHSQWGLWLGTIRLWQLLKRLRPTIVHTHLVQASLIGRLAARWVSTPVILSTQHNAYYPKQHAFVHRLERCTWRMNTGMIALSGAIERHMRKFGYGGRISVIPTGVDTTAMTDEEQQATPPNFEYILSVGHFRDGQKGHDTLLRAFVSVRTAHPNVKLLIAGEGHERSQLSEMATSLGLGNSVQFLGNREDVPSLMRGCKVFALPSRWEGFGRVLVEAMAMGCAIVASDSEGIPEVVQREVSGILVPPDRPQLLATAIKVLLSNETLANAFRAHARRSVEERYTLARMVENVSSLYDSLVDEVR